MDEILPVSLSVYQPHDYTIKIAGATHPKRAASCALHHLMNGREPVEFLSIGANAGQQAAKAMAFLLAFFNENEPDMHRCMALQPLWYEIEVPVPHGAPDAPKEMRRCIVWRVVTFHSSVVSLTKATLHS